MTCPHMLRLCVICEASVTIPHFPIPFFLNFIKIYESLSTSSKGVEIARKVRPGGN